MKEKQLEAMYLSPKETEKGNGKRNGKAARQHFMSEYQMHAMIIIQPHKTLKKKLLTSATQL